MLVEDTNAIDLSAVTGALGALKALTGIAKDVNNIELNQKINSRLRSRRFQALPDVHPTDVT
jgi:hypothetical protein